MKVGDFLTNAACKFPHRTALVDLKDRWTFEEFNVRVNRLANAMLNAGIRKGDRVASMFFNSHHFVEVYMACTKIGALIVPVNFRFLEKEIEYILTNSDASTFFFGKEFYETVKGLKDRLANVKRWITPDGQKSPFYMDYEMFLSPGSAKEPEVEVMEPDECQVMYTSGTTDKPRGAIITHGNVIWNLFNTILGREDKAGETALIIGPLYHTAALNNHFTIQIALGGTSILIKKFDPEEIFKTIQNEKATVISGSPAMYNLLLRFPHADRYDTCSINKCTVGSAILPVEIQKKLQRLFPNIKGIYDVYGCTEASPSITILRDEDSRRKEGSVGPSLPFLEARIMDPGGPGSFLLVK